MTYVKVAAVIGLAVALAACPDGDRDMAATDLQTRDTLPAERAGGALPGTETFTLDPFAGSAASGEVRATPVDGAVEMVIAIQGAQPNATVSVSLHTGSCEAPGPEVADLGDISTDPMGRGQVRTTVGLQAHQVLNGMHIIAAHTEGGETSMPIACSRVPQHHGGAGIGAPGA
jgi:hypothetical protein